MKKSLKKTIASFVAVASMVSSIVGISASASSESLSDDIMSLDIIAANLDSTPFYYTPYDYYDVYNIAPTHHYMAAVVPSNVSLPNSFGVYFYVNTNIISSTPTDFSNFIIDPAYSPYASLNTVTSSTFSSSCKCIFAKFNKTGNPTLPAALFSYYLAGVENNNAVNSEYDLHCMTSASPSYPSTALYTNTGDSLVKIVYALGDVDKNGIIDQDDATAIQKYILHNTQAAPGTSATEAAYDKIAFELAADYNQDGTINMLDVLLLNV